MHEKAIEEDPWQLYTVRDCFRTLEMCSRAAEDELEALEYVPDHLKTKEMCKEAVRRKPYTLRHVPNHLRTQEMCEDVIHVRLEEFFLIPDCFKTQEMCIRAVKVTPWQLYGDRDYFVILQEMWCEDFDDNDYLINWHNAYQKCKAQKAQIKKEVLPIT